MIDWNPISSAPRDGRVILGYMSHDWIEGAFWDEGKWRWSCDGDGAEYDNQPKYWAEINYPEEVA